jgi:hypothetical protein
VAIDNPLEKIREITNEDEKDPLGGFLQAAGIVHPLFAIAGVAKGLVDSERRWERIRASIRGLCDELMQIEDRWPKQLQEAFDSVWFKRAVTVLIEESARAVNEEYAQLLGRVAARGCFPTGQDAHRQEDLASYIHDLSRLGTDDIQFLKLLKSENLEAIRTGPNLNIADAFSSRFDNFRSTLARLKIDPDDGISIGARLAGFGLAYEAPRMNSGQSPVEHCFRPTKRGLYLLSLLEAAEFPVEKQN